MGKKGNKIQDCRVERDTGFGISQSGIQEMST